MITWEARDNIIELFDRFIQEWIIVNNELTMNSKFQIHHQVWEELNKLFWENLYKLIDENLTLANKNQELEWIMNDLTENVSSYFAK